MFNDIIQFLDGLKDVFLNNMGLSITTLITAATSGAVIGLRTKLSRSRKDNILAQEDNRALRKELNTIKNNQQLLSSKIDDVQQDQATTGEILNVMAQNSRASGPETKNKIKNMVTKLKGLSPEMIKRIHDETQEILKQLEIPKEVEVIREKVEKIGNSILDRYLEEVDDIDDENTKEDIELV